MQQEIVELILQTAGEIAEEEEWEIKNFEADTVLYGENGVLDSMGLVSLVIAVEQAIEDQFGKAVGLADEKAMSQSKSPYRSADTLAAYAASEMQDA